MFGLTLDTVIYPGNSRGMVFYESNMHKLKYLVYLRLIQFNSLGLRDAYMRQ